MTQAGDKHRYKPLDKFHKISIHPTLGPVAVTTAGGLILAQSAETQTVSEWDSSEGLKQYPDVYYFPPEHVNFDLLVKSSTITYCPYKGYATYYSVRGGEKDVAWVYKSPYKQADALGDYIAFNDTKVRLHRQ